jgi:general secretion pathway protein J
MRLVNPRNTFLPAERGFTLVEIVLALAILAVILSVLYVAYATSVEVMQTAQRRTEKYQEVRVIFDLLSHQLASAYLSPKDKRSVFIGEDDSSGEFPLDRLTFTASASAFSPFGGSYGGLCKIRYFVQSHTEGDREKSLFRQEICPLVATEDVSNEKGITLELSSQVVGLDFKYYVGEEGEEFDSWDTSQILGVASLPSRVKVTLLFPGEDTGGTTGERGLQPFSTIIEIPAAEHQPQSP